MKKNNNFIKILVYFNYHLSEWGVKYMANNIIRAPTI